MSDRILPGAWDKGIISVHLFLVWCEWGVRPCSAGSDQLWFVCKNAVKKCVDVHILLSH